MCSSWRGELTSRSWEFKDYDVKKYFKGAEVTFNSLRKNSPSYLKNISSAAGPTKRNLYLSKMMIISYYCALEFEFIFIGLQWVSSVCLRVYLRSGLKLSY